MVAVDRHRLLETDARSGVAVACADGLDAGRVGQDVERHRKEFLRALATRIEFGEICRRPAPGAIERRSP